MVHVRMVDARLQPLLRPSTSTVLEMWVFCCRQCNRNRIAEWPFSNDSVIRDSVFAVIFAKQNTHISARRRKVTSPAHLNHPFTRQ
ncbi:hypothetical protein [Bifidobacterium leontopitheci]|uniref:hypothetical protein n=1 Tax=Bifidobacterium leontopitheci TaxID=2650774 RepID=UPI0012643491